MSVGGSVWKILRVENFRGGSIMGMMWVSPLVASSKGKKKSIHIDQETEKKNDKKPVDLGISYIQTSEI